MTAHAVILPALQRSHGEAMVVLDRSDAGKTRLRQLRQLGSAKAILPQVGDVPEVVFLNTSGGLTGGDVLRFRLDVGAGAKAVATTQTAERAYRSSSGAATVGVEMKVGPGGWLDWLPQETILFDGSALDRKTDIDLHGDAGCLALEAVILGRPAMGEVVKHLMFRDLRRIRRDGHLIAQEPLMLNGAALLAGAAVVGDARAFASLIMVGQGAEACLGATRAVLDEPGVDAAASAWDGKLGVRLMARDGYPLRRQICRVLEAVRPGPLPRVWQI